ncbi:MAG: ABC transporter ATP-binding protein [Acidobacteriia bacterium]|nr:ABC transporter ATP-binding protein [Terriglobia bacterium]
MTLLEARELSGGYGADDVVRRVDLTVTEGQCVGVLGPNGAGKSTLLRLLAGILPTTSGMVELIGRPLATWRRREVARVIGFVPQAVSFAFPLTVAEVVQQGRAPHLGPWRPPAPRDHAAVAAAIARVGLSGRETTAVQRLSGGERQLVLLARALASEPRLLLLDEPATALDVRHQLELVAILRALVRSGVGVVLVLHDWNLALRLADRLVILKGGQVSAVGAPAEVVRPDLFREVFGVEIALVPEPGGVPLIVARSSSGMSRQGE